MKQGELNEIIGLSLEAAGHSLLMASKLFAGADKKALALDMMSLQKTTLRIFKVYGGKDGLQKKE